MVIIDGCQIRDRDQTEVFNPIFLRPNNKNPSSPN